MRRSKLFPAIAITVIALAVLGFAASTSSIAQASESPLTARPAPIEIPEEEYDEGAAITVRALGKFGNEDIQLVVNGRQIASIELTKEMREYVFATNYSVTDLEIRFKDGFKRDARIDYVKVNDTIYQSEDSSVQAKGTWDKANQCRGGNKRSEWLHCTGYFRYPISPARSSSPELPSINTRTTTKDPARAPAALKQPAKQQVPYPTTTAAAKRSVPIVPYTTTIPAAKRSAQKLPQRTKRTTLKQSGPVNVTSDGATIQNLDINSTADEGCGIRIHGRKNVTVKNVNITHAGAGICISDSENITVDTVRLVNTIEQAGPHCRPGLTPAECKRVSRRTQPDLLYKVNSNNNISVTKSKNVTLDTLYLEKGESGIWTHTVEGLKINNFHCRDVRGPYWRGQCVQVVESDNASISRFYIEQFLETSSGHDNINAFKSTNVTVSDGLIDGNYSRNGVGVIADKDADNMTVKNVDIIHNGVAGVNVWSGPTSEDNGSVAKNFLVENVRVKDGHCQGTWYGPDVHPSSGGAAFSMHPHAKNARYLNSTYWNPCDEARAIWGPRKAAVRNIVKQPFTTKAPPININFPWLNN